MTKLPVSGFGQNTPEVFSQNKHAGLYFADSGKNSRDWIPITCTSRSQETLVQMSREPDHKKRKNTKSCNFQKSKSSKQLTASVR